MFSVIYLVAFTGDAVAKTVTLVLELPEQNRSSLQGLPPLTTRQNTPATSAASVHLRTPITPTQPRSVCSDAILQLLCVLLDASERN